MLALKKIYSAIADRIPPAIISELLKECRESFQGYDLIKDKRDREYAKNENGQQKPVDAKLDISKSCKKRGKRHPKNT